MSVKLRFELPEKLCLRDPQDTKYGHRLLSHSVELLDELGFEAFTFKKLAASMESTEVSIYRYFENKHLLLLYLNCWYWEWVTYLIDINTLNIEDPKERLSRAIHFMIHATTESQLCQYVNEGKLFQIIMKESTKTYHIASVDEENKYGFFLPYKNLVSRITSIIESIDPNFPYARSIGSTLFEMINSQLFYAEHLPRLTSLSKKETVHQLEKMVNHFAFAALSYTSTSEHA